MAFVSGGPPPAGRAGLGGLFSCTAVLWSSGPCCFLVSSFVVVRPRPRHWALARSPFSCRCSSFVALRPLPRPLALALAPSPGPGPLPPGPLARARSFRFVVRPRPRPRHWFEAGPRMAPRCSPRPPSPAPPVPRRYLAQAPGHACHLLLESLLLQFEARYCYTSATHCYNRRFSSDRTTTNIIGVSMVVFV